MNSVYSFAMRLQDLVSPTLQRISGQYAKTVSAMERMNSRVSSGFSRAAQSVDQLRRKLTFGKEIQSIDQLKQKLDALTRKHNLSLNTGELSELTGKLMHYSARSTS